MLLFQIKLLILSGFTVSFFFFEAKSQHTEHNTLSQQEKEEGWELLFDGTSAEHWRGYNMDRFPDEAWVAEDGVLAFYPTVEEGWAGLDIITKEKYQDFEFTAEWKIEEGGNSGIFHHVIEQPGIDIYWSGPEMQIHDSPSAGELYDVIPSDPSPAKPAGEWNSVRIISDGPHVEYWLNGEKVVEFERWSAEWFELIRDSKFREEPSFGAAPKGHIGLQDHPGWAKFRNLKIRRLN